MADDPNVQFSQRLKKSGINGRLSTCIVSSKKFTSADLEDWAIASLVALKPDDAIDIIKNLHFNQNVGNKKSAVLCARINSFKESAKEEVSPGQQGGQGKGQPNQRGGHPDQRGGHPDQRGGHPDQRGGHPNQRGGHPNQRGSHPDQHGGHPDQREGHPNQRGGNPNQRGGHPDQRGGHPDQRGGHPNQHGGHPNQRGGHPDQCGGHPDQRGGHPNQRGGHPNQGNRGSFGNAGFPDDQGNHNYHGNEGFGYAPDNQSDFGDLGNRGNPQYQGNRGNQGNRGPRRGRDGSLPRRGHHDNSPEIVTNINMDDNNQTERSRGGNRCRGRGRGQARGNQRGRRGSRQNSRGDNQVDEDEDSGSDSDSDSSETSIISGSGASRSAISGNQDLHRERLQDFDETKKNKRPRRKPRGGETLEDERVDENKIFSYLVKSCGGFIAFDEFVSHCDLLPSDIDIHKWFRCHKRRFKLFEKEGKLLYISAFYRDVTLCLGYNCLFGRNKLCSKTDCEHFHICKNFISGNCSFGETCKYSHSFRDANNLEHKKKLGLHEFSDKEMVVILGNRYPRICSEFLKTTSCQIGESCSNLHVCSLSLRGKCPRETDCPLGHSLETDHNTWVLQALEYHAWLNGKAQFLLKKVILVDRSLEALLGVETIHKEEQEICCEELFDIADEIATLQKKPGKKVRSRANRFKTEDPDEELAFNLNQVHMPEASSSVDPPFTEESTPEPAGKAEPKPSKKKTKKTPKPKQNKQAVHVDTPTTWLDDAAYETPICVKHVEGTCTGICPKGHHHPPDGAPYVWQFKHEVTWCSFSPEYSQEIEEGFCKHHEVIDAEILVEDTVYMVHVCVTDARNAKGVVYEQDGVMLTDPHSLPVRRLSTQSYVDVKDQKLPGSPAFSTQWRWSWRNDEGLWLLFDPENFQKTLERKYKYGQPTYLFTRDNYRFKYRIDFRTFRQVNLDTMKTSDLCRRPLFVSLEDVSNKTFPDCLEVVDPISKPANFTPWDLSNDFELVELDRVKPEFKTLRDRLFETMDSGRFDLLYIYRVQNWHLYQEYELRKRNMKKEIASEGQSHDVNEKLLFHGTDSMKTCQGICTNNFDFRTSGKNATLYGEGSYFAETSKYSHNYTQPGKNKERYMFRAKVLVGLYTKGNDSYRRPPERPRQTHKLYDSCVDDEGTPNMYIIFERSQSYPEYLIAYREKSTSDDHVIGRVGGVRAVATQGLAVAVKPPAPKPVVTTPTKPSEPKPPSTPPAPVPAPPAPVPAPPAPIPAPRVSRAPPSAPAPLQPIVYPSYPTHGASSYPAASSLDPLSYPTATASYPHDNIQRSPSNEEQGSVGADRSFMGAYETGSVGADRSSMGAYETGSVGAESSFGGAFGKRITEDEMNQYYAEDHIERKRRAEKYATNLATQKERTPQQKKKDDGCILQ